MAGDVTNPFDVLGVPARFDLDEKDLQGRYLALSAAAHPDRVTDPLEQAEAAERAAAINAAYRQLRNPITRAEALLALRGFPATGDAALPPDLLMQILEAREELEEAQATADHATLARLQTWAAEQREAGLNAVGNALAQEPIDAQAVRVQLSAIRTFDRMLQAG